MVKNVAKPPELYLHANESYLTDVGKKVARIDSESMRFLGIAEGEQIEVIRNRSVKLNCFNLYANEQGIRIIRLSKEDCHEAGASFGDMLLVRKAKVKS
jgi:hypothetical protein